MGLELRWWIVNDLLVVLWALMVLGGAGLSYAILPRFFHGLARSVRELPGAKLPVLSLVWGGATVVLPLMIVGADLEV